MNGHIRSVCKNPRECPETCNICQLFECSVCGGFEGSLLPKCPGVRLTQAEHDANYKHYCAGTGPFGCEACGAPTGHGWQRRCPNHYQKGHQD